MSLFINISLPYNLAESFFLSITKSDCLHKVLSEYRYHRNFTELETTNRHCTNMCFCLWFCLKKKKKKQIKSQWESDGEIIKGTVHSWQVLRVTLRKTQCYVKRV